LTKVAMWARSVSATLGAASSVGADARGTSSAAPNEVVVAAPPKDRRNASGSGRGAPPVAARSCTVTSTRSTASTDTLAPATVAAGAAGGGPGGGSGAPTPNGIGGGFGSGGGGSTGCCRMRRSRAAAIYGRSAAGGSGNPARGLSVRSLEDGGRARRRRQHCRCCHEHRIRRFERLVRVWRDGRHRVGGTGRRHGSDAAAHARSRVTLPRERRRECAVVDK
jgi:hypothetical protein